MAGLRVFSAKEVALGQASPYASRIGTPRGATRSHPPAASAG